MSSPRVLRPPAAATVESNVAKRGRKARPFFTDDDKQRERKRAMDRIAQRVSREKTRSHIAHLEKMVEILCEKNESEATTELMAEVSRLNTEIDRLRKIIETIKSVLRADTFELENHGRQKENDNSSRSGSQNPEAAEELKATTVPESAPQLEQQQQQQEHSVFDEIPDSSAPEQKRSHKRARTSSFVGFEVEDIASPPRPARVQFPEPEFPEPHPSLNFTPAWSCAVIPRRRPTHNRSMSVSQIGALPSQLWAQLYPRIPAEISTFKPPLTTSPCRIWQKSNRIYAKLFNIKKQSSWAADEISTGTLFKAVKEGWNSLPSNLQLNPVLAVLREIDVEVFPRLDRVTRAALMIKSHLLMKYFLNSEEKNWSLMPTWQRPVPSQSSLQHPIAIDFFAWPGLRDRLVSNHAHYFANPPRDRRHPKSQHDSAASSPTKDDPTAGIADFSVAYQHHFRFSWPFTFDDSYLYDPVTQEYSISPMFQRYHGDLKYWGVEPAFFEKFPEFKGVMSAAHVYEPADGHEDAHMPRRSVSPADTDASQNPPRDMNPGISEPLSAHNSPEDGRRDSGSGNSATSSITAPSPEEVHLTEMCADVEMMDGLEGTLGKGEGLTFEFEGQERQHQGQGQGQPGVVYRGADAYLMELFNDMPSVV